MGTELGDIAQERVPVMWATSVILTADPSLSWGGECLYLAKYLYEPREGKGRQERKQTEQLNLST